MHDLSKGYCKGDITFPDGTTYSGEIENGQFNGKGTLNYSNGEKYTGEFVNGKREGRGTLIFAKGQKYIGPFKDDKIHGIGRYYENGKEYVTEFNIGKQISCTKVEKDTSMIATKTPSTESTSKTLSRSLTSKGSHNSNNSSSQDEPKSDYTWSDGSYYVGEMKGGKPNGMGTRYYPNGREVYGLWQSGYMTYSPSSSDFM